MSIGFSRCGGVFRAEQAIRRFVLLDGGEAAYGRLEAVVQGVVVYLAHLPQQHRPRARQQGEIVVEPGIAAPA